LVLEVLVVPLRVPIQEPLVVRPVLVLTLRLPVQRHLRVPLVDQVVPVLRLLCQFWVVPVELPRQALVM
jgi:hypothetical protein